MNRLVTTNIEGVSPAVLPPKGRQGPVRMLFLSTQILGYKVTCAQFEQHTATREDIDAVHIRLIAPTWLKVLGKSIAAMRGFDFHAYRHMVQWKFLISRWLRTSLPLDHFDVVHFTTQGNALAALTIPRQNAPKVVVNIDATAAREAGDFHYSIFDRRPLIAAERKIFARADLVGCLSSWARQSVIDDYGVNPDRAVISRIGMTIPPPAPSAIADKARTDRLFRIVYVGNHWERKGGQRLLTWHQQRWADRAELHIFGKDAPKDESCRNVIWHGPTPREKLLSELLPAMDLFVLPTREDTLVLAAVEALGAGVPVVASRLAGIESDVVQHGETGLLCPVKDDSAFIAAVEKLMSDDALRRSMSELGRERITRDWNPQKCLGAYFDRVVALANR